VLLTSARGFARIPLVVRKESRKKPGGHDGKRDCTAMKEPAVFDTLAIANDLQEAGFDRKQSEGLAKIVARLVLTLQSELSRLEKSQAQAIKEGIATAMAEARTQRTIMYGAFLPIQLALLILMITMVGFIMNLSGSA